LVITDIFNYRNGESLQPTGYLPSFIDSLIAEDLLKLEFLYGDSQSDKTAAVPRVQPVEEIDP